ncbi:MAG: phosphatase PAP2 family protein [Chloroflexota bacterium]|nr:phosphatase PAP2 family protein [Chloroflexota bacterium]
MTSDPISDKDIKLAEERIEEKQRFERLRHLIYDPAFRHRVILGLNVLALVIVTLLAFMAYTVQRVVFDVETTLGFQTVGGELFLELMTWVSVPGDMPWSVLVVSGGILLIGVLLGWKEGAFLFLVTGIQGLVNTLFKNFIDRARPTTELVEVFVPAGGFSFPSGHVMFYTVFFGFLFFLAWTRFPRSIWKGLLLFLTGALVLLIGPSRIYLGAHWLSDVVAAYLVSLIILSLVIEFYLFYIAPPNEFTEGGILGRYDRMLREQEEVESGGT